MQITLGTNNTNVDINDIITFTTKNNYNNVAITGVVEGVCKSGIASSIYDIITYNQQVNKSITPLGPLVLENMDYVLVRSQEGTLRAYAFEWIDECDVVSDNGDITITLKRITTEQLNSIMVYLSGVGIAAKVIRQ